MKKKLFLKFFVLAVIGAFVTFTSCKDYDDDINKVSNDLAALKTELNSKLDAQKDDLQSQITQLRTDLDKAITQEDLNAILAGYVKLQAFEDYKDATDDKLLGLREDVDKAATKEELEILEGYLDSEITRVLDKLALEIEGVEELIELAEGRLEGLIELAEGRLEGLIQDLRDELVEPLAQIQTNKDDIADLYAFLGERYESLNEMDDELRALIAQKVDITTFNTEVQRIDDAAAALREDMEDEIERVDALIVVERLRINTLFGFTRQLKALTYIPTRGLPNEKTMKLYYFAGDYSAEHVLMYRVSPSNAQLGRDFTVESLNYQITTRSADDGVNDASSEVDVHINPTGTYKVAGQSSVQQGVKQFGDVLYVPVHVKSDEPCDVYGNLDWWCNEYFYGNWNVLWENNFPAHVVKTKKNPEVNYYCEYGDEGSAPYYEGSAPYYEGLTLVLTADAENVADGGRITIKSTEHVNTYLVPTQIKLAESRTGQGNQILDSNLQERTLNTTFTAAVNWANENENTLPPDNKNWNVLAWSGNQGQGGVWTPGSIDLYDYVSSFYYPQDGGDLSRENTVSGDPHRYLWAEFGKEFGRPYTDKPHYDKPVYEFEQMTWKDTNHNITIGPEVGVDGATHSYASLDGSILTVHDDASSIQGVRNKKIIIKVTQVNSDCEERQPVGYLVLKYTDDPNQQWPDAFHTIDLTHIPYYHKECRSTDDPVGDIIPKTYNDGDVNATFNQKDALLDPFAHDRFMNPINAPGSYGMTGVINPGDVNEILGSNLQLNGIGEHNMGVIYNIQRRDADVVSKSFVPADYNHINVTDPTSPIYVSQDEAFEHVMIRYEYDNHSYIVYVDDKAPAGEYEIEYELLNMENNTQHGNRLYLTFKFKVALREITVERDTPNWLNENTIRGTHTRVGNTIDPNSGVATSQFLSSLDGYKVDLKQAFVLGTGTNQNVLVTTQEPTGAGPNPNYRPKFEFIPNTGITGAGFTYHRDTDNYLTIIKLGTQDAAVIDNSPSGSSSPDYNYLTIYVNEAGDKLYNYLTQDVNSAFGPHNTITKWGKKELRLDDDMERLLPVRMVTDINGACQVEDVPVGGTPSVFVDRFPNGNYYYIMDFNVKFERALRWAFTTVELDDSQYLQSEAFNFRTKYVDPLDEDLDIYRGLFDHSYDDATDHYGNLVYPAVQFGTGRHNRGVQAWYYGLATSLLNPDFATAPTMVRENHVQPNVGTNYQGIDYKFVEISTDGGNTWAPMDNDYQVNSTHTARYFDIIYTPGTYPFGQPVTPPSWTAIWQGDHTPLNQDLYFRVPVYNTIATGHGLDLSTATADDLWVGYRDGWAKVKGYAVFKINKQ